YERFEDRPSPEQVRAALAEYRASGILGNISEADLARYTEEALASEYVRFNDIILSFPGVSRRIYLKSDYEKPYAAVLHEHSALSHGRFRPEQIVDKSRPEAPDKQGVRVSFAVGGKTYSGTFRSLGRWFDPGIFDLVIRAQEETDPIGRFHTLYDDNDAHLI